MKKLALALLAASLSTNAFAAAEEAWPRLGEGFYLSVQQPPKGGRIAFAYVRATPDRKDKTAWTVTVECGQMAAGTGKYVSRITGTGRAERGRVAAIGGTLDIPGGPGSSFIFGLPKASALETSVQFTDARCASGKGELSSGD